MPPFRILLAMLLAADLWLWLQLAAIERVGAKAYFLNVGQGDSILLQTAGGVRVLIDAGAGESVLKSLEAVLPQGERYIDFAIITHAQADHFSGFSEIFDRYEVGAIVWNGRGAENSPGWDAFFAKAEAEAPLVTIRAGDSIRIGADVIRFLSPDNILAGSGDLNDSSIVSLAEISGVRLLLTGDAGFASEARITEPADILKVAHHGSKFSSSEKFLRQVRPRIAIIQSGEGNSYGHPSEEVLFRLAKAGAAIFRNDTHGTLELRLAEDRVTVLRR